MEERVKLLEDAVKDLPNITVDCYDGLVVEYARKKVPIAIVRGLRAVTDFEFEFKLAAMNRNLEPSIETVFMMTSSEYSFISSSSVKEVASLGGDVYKWVTQAQLSSCMLNTVPNRGVERLNRINLIILLDKLEDLIEQAPEIPLTGRVLLDADEVLDLLERIRNAVPEEVKRAEIVSIEKRTDAPRCP